MRVLIIMLLLCLSCAADLSDRNVSTSSKQYYYTVVSVLHKEGSDLCTYRFMPTPTADYKMPLLACPLLVEANCSSYDVGDRFYFTPIQMSN